MSVYSDLRTALVARLNAVADIGTVSNRQRWSAQWSDYLDSFQATIGGTTQIRGWMVSLERIESAPMSFGNTSRIYVFLARGVMGLDDSANTEGTFLDLCEAVLNSVDGRTDLGSAVVIDYSVGPSVLRLVDHRLFGSVLCHYCEIEVRAEAEIAVTYA